MPNSGTRILIVAPAWVGDMVMAHSLVQVLIARHGDPGIDMLAPRATAGLGARMPGVRNVHVLDVEHGELALGARRSSGLTLKDQYDQAIVLPNSFKSALAPAWARIPVRTGWSGEARVGVLNDRRRLNPERYPRMVDRFAALGLDPDAPLPDDIPGPVLEPDAAAAERLLASRRLSVDGGVTALCPGAEFGPAKRWPSVHFAQVASYAAAQGHQVWLVGSPKDAGVCSEVEAQSPAGVVNLAGRTTLLEAVDLLSRADRVVSNDSGLMHVASALGRPVVGVFGSTSTTFTPPLGERATTVSLGIECSPCFQRECPLGHLRCLNDLPPQRVIELL
ncbi:MAG TPA: lipopolysaccharide heptosyltransferase II [Pseudomonadales bacterium]